MPHPIEVFCSSELSFLASMDVHRLQIHQGIVTHISGNRGARPQLSCPDCPYQAGGEGEGIFRHCLQHLQPSAPPPSPAPPRNDCSTKQSWGTASAECLTSHWSPRVPLNFMNKCFLFCCMSLNKFLGTRSVCVNNLDQFNICLAAGEFSLSS